MSDMFQMIDRFLELRAQKDALSKQLRPIQDELNNLERDIGERFTKEEMQAVTRGGYNVYRRREISVKPKEGYSTDDLVDRFRKARLGDLIGVQHQRLKAWAKERMFNKTTGEWEPSKSDLPPSIAEIVEVSEFYKLGCRKA